MNKEILTFFKECLSDESIDATTKDTIIINLSYKIKENKQEETNKLNRCVICSSKELNIIFSACGHLCICDKCELELEPTRLTKKCPICRRRSTTAKVYY